jgi:hypothetical protein
VSKLKTPHQKKLASLALDRRNVYGENDKASRKLIPLLKQQSQQALRRAAKMPMLSPENFIEDEAADRAEFAAKTAIVQGNRNAFKKRPDAPLGVVLKEKAEPYIPVWQGGDRLGGLRELYDKKKRKIDRS